MQLCTGHVSPRFGTFADIKDWLIVRIPKNILMQIQFETRFTNQFRSVCACSSNTVALAGGLDPISGSRSVFSAALVMFDCSSNEILWEVTVEKNKPFSDVTSRGDAIASAVPLNFTRLPSGLFLYTTDGEFIEALEINGLLGLLTHNDVIFACAESSDSVFLYSLTSAKLNELFELPIEESRSVCHFAIVDDRIVLSFIQGEKSKFRFAHECWSIASRKLLWQIESKNNEVLVHENAVVTYNSGEFCQELEIRSQLDGTLDYKIPIKGPGISKLAFKNDSLYLANHSRQFACIELNSKNTKLIEFATEVPGWLTFDLVENFAIALCSNNHMKPETKLAIINLNE